MKTARPPEVATASGVEWLEQLAALLIRVHTYETRGLTHRMAVLTAAADYRANPSAVLARVREGAGGR